MALDAGHPVYFMIFFTAPLPDQTLADVRNAHTRFIEEVRRRHPDAPKPAVIGNCQGGWAAALIGAERPDQVGPMVSNGSPLSYWAGVEGANPMRYRGGLLGGVWFTSFLSDLGNGTFDGVHLVANFEDLNPANTFWKKYYHLFANVDTEPPRSPRVRALVGRLLPVESRGIEWITQNLFVGNKPGEQPSHQGGCLSALVVFMKARHGRADVVVREQLESPPGVFGSDEADLAEHAEGSDRDVFEVADRGRDHEERYRA